MLHNSLVIEIQPLAVGSAAVIYLSANVGHLFGGVQGQCVSFGCPNLGIAFGCWLQISTEERVWERWQNEQGCDCGSP